MVWQRDGIGVFHPDLSSPVVLPVVPSFDGSVVRDQVATRLERPMRLVLRLSRGNKPRIHMSWCFRKGWVVVSTLVGSTRNGPSTPVIRLRARKPTAVREVILHGAGSRFAVSEEKRRSTLGNEEMRVR